MDDEEATGRLRLFALLLAARFESKLYAGVVGPICRSVSWGWSTGESTSAEADAAGCGMGRWLVDAEALTLE